MIGQDSRELIAVFRLQQVFDGAIRQSCEGVVGRSKNSEILTGCQSVGEAGGLCGGEQRFESARFLRGFDDIIRHRGAAQGHRGRNDGCQESLSHWFPPLSDHLRSR